MASAIVIALATGPERTMLRIMWTKAVWEKVKEDGTVLRVTGSYYYHWSRDQFTVILDDKDEITGRNRQINDIHLNGMDLNYANSHLRL